MSAAPVIEYLQKLQAQGQTHLNVDDEARLILREFYIRAQGKPRTPAAVQTSPQLPPQVSQVASPTAQISPLKEAPVEVATQPQEPPPKEELTLSGNSTAEKLTELKRYVANFPAAKTLGTLRQTMIFSVGNPHADIMLVGEAPGFDDERLGEPFIGKAGQKLTGILQAMGCKREDTYLTHIVKYRPASDNQTTLTRKPSAAEIAAFLPIFQEEVKAVAPKVIIALGAKAGQALLASESSVADLRGANHEYMGTPLRVTYHPSYILQDGNTPEKRELWEDMLAVMELLDLPISEKQQGYFKQK